MKLIPQSVLDGLYERESNNALRVLPEPSNLVDFSSNDYLGFSNSKEIFDAATTLLIENQILSNGATGSRLLTGNHKIYQETESLIANFHNVESALLFNSGYTANIGLFSSVPQRTAIIFYDEYIHASIRDGIAMSNAKSYKFKHNNLEHLKAKIASLRKTQLKEVYIVTESVFSMDGDAPDLVKMANFCTENGFYFIVDEAHATGVFGKNGRGKVQELGIENQVFARIITFGKALGCHGAAVVGSSELCTYLTNFARSFIYTTGLPPHTVAVIQIIYHTLIAQDIEQKNHVAIVDLKQNITQFKLKIEILDIKHLFIPSNSAIHCAIVPENNRVKSVANRLQCDGFDVKAILSPTVPKGKERLRFCLHNYNSFQEISDVLELLATFVA